MIPQADITAQSVRKRLQMGSSEQANSCFRSSNANKTRVETGGRPRLVGLGKRWANERSMAATRAAHGNVSAHGRMGCVSGTKSATWRHGPRRSAHAEDIARSASSSLLGGGARETQHTPMRLTSPPSLRGNQLVVTNYEVDRRCWWKKLLGLSLQLTWTLLIKHPYSRPVGSLCQTHSSPGYPDIGPPYIPGSTAAPLCLPQASAK